MPDRTSDQIVAEIRYCYEKALDTIAKQQSQLSLALSLLADLGFDLEDFADLLG